MNVAVVERDLLTLPAVLRDRPRWVGFFVRDGKKVPCIVDNPTRNASCTNPATWRRFGAALAGLRAGHYDGVGYALGGEYIVADLDHCIRDGQMDPRAAEIVARLDTYTELSVSGAGIHIWLAGNLPEGRGRKLDGIEVYCGRRFIIMTGNRLPGTPPAIRAAAPGTLDWLLQEEPSVSEISEQSKAMPSALSDISETVLSGPSGAGAGVRAVGVRLDPDAIRQMVLATVPDKPGVRNRRLLDLARVLRLNAGLTFGEAKHWVQEWHSMALPNVRTKGFTDSWIDFAIAWSRVRVPLGFQLAETWRRAQAEPEPAEANDYDEPVIKGLVRLCRTLAGLSSDGRFFLGSHAAARLMGCEQMQVWRALRLLEVDGLLEVMHRGHAGHGGDGAARFRWLGTLAPAPAAKASENPAPAPEPEAADPEAINAAFDESAVMDLEGDAEELVAELKAELQRT